MGRKYRKIGGNKFYRSWKLWEEGETLEGQLVDISEDNYGKPNYHIKVETANFELEYNGKEMEAGSILCLNACGSIDHKLEQFDPADKSVKIFCKFTYLGEGQIDNEKSKFNGKPFHDVDVEIYEDEGGGNTNVHDFDGESEEEMDL